MSPGSKNVAATKDKKFIFGKRNVDATKGPLVPLIVTFVIPLVLTTMLQQLFNEMNHKFYIQ